MDKRIRILHLEDDAADAELVQATLEAGGISVEVRRVQARADFEQALGRGGCDIILADVTLPGYDGLTALSLARELAPDIPFVFVSGTMGEDAAIAALTQGAMDYVLKQKLSRLVPAVRRALEDAEDKRRRSRAEAALRESEERYRTLVEQSAMGVGISQGNRAVFANPALLRFFGYDNMEDFIKVPLLDHVTPSSRNLILELMGRAAKDATHSAEFEYEALRKDGQVRILRAQTFHVTLGGEAYTQTAFQDVTERKQEEDNFRRSLDESPLGVRVESLGGDTLYANQAFLDMYGFADTEDFRGAPIESKYTPETYQEFLKRKAMRDRGEFGPSQYEVDIVRKDGEVRHLKVYRKNILWSGEQQLQVIYIDMTDERRAEAGMIDFYGRFERALAASLKAISRLVEMRDPYTSGHEERVAELAVAIAVEMGLDPDVIEGLHVAGLVHDVGKISVPAEILSKPTLLNPMEMGIVRMHAERGFEILQGFEFPWPVAEITWQHHERWDGSGYPRGLKAENILVEARILAVADTVEAMASHRPYRPAFSIETVLQEIETNSARLYDPRVAAACLHLFRQKNYALSPRIESS